MELLAWMQRANFSEHIQRFKPHGNSLNSSHFDAPNTKSALTGYRRAPNIIPQHYKQELSAKASIIQKLNQSGFDKTARQRYQQPETDTIVRCAPNPLSL